MYFLAIFIPWLALFIINKPIQGLVCLLLWITLIGWLPAAIWAIMAVNNHNADKRNKELIRNIQTYGGR